jgi:hypothetical protein
MTTTDIELRSGNGHVSREWIELLEPAAALANTVAGTGFVPRALQGNPAGIVAAILYGDELGLGPMQSLAKISVIEGKPTLSAEAQRALILAAGHELRVDEATATRLTLSGRRSGSTEWTSVTWTLDDAKRANIAGKQNWRLYPRQMLAARATAELARLVFADVIGGLAATEEIEDADPLTLLEAAMSGPLAEPEKPKTTRRKRTRKSPALEAPAEGEETGQGEDAGTTAPALPPLPDEPAETLLEPTPEPEPEPGEPRGDSPADDSIELGDSGVAGSEGEVAQDDETTASSVSGDEPDASPSQLKALDKIVGTQRETEVELADGTKAPILTTAQVWAATATRRNVDVDVMIELLGGRDEAGVLHWSPLRDSLTKSEASDLIAKLEDRARKWGVT